MTLATTVGLIAALGLAWGGMTYSQAQAVPTLVPPTLVPTLQRPLQDFILAESGVARIAREGKVRIGVLYNEPPFGEINVRGELSGMDADLGRLLAQTWGVEVVFVQVTRQNRLEQVERGLVDLLIAAQVQRRELDSRVEFSEPYRVGRQAVMVRSDDGAQALNDLTTRRLGVVLGTEGEAALRNWQARRGLNLQVQSYLIADQAVSALFAQEVDAVVGRVEHLRRLVINQLDSVRFLEEPLEVEPFAVVVARQDSNLRLLVNRTLQYLVQREELQKLHARYFPGERFPTDALTLWANVGNDAPKPAMFNEPLKFPLQYAVPRIRASGVLRVAGLLPLPVDASEGERRLDQFNRAIVDQVAARLGLQVELVDHGDFVEAVEQNWADVAVGLSLDWNLANRIDFSQAYGLRGDRLMVKANSSIMGFNELRGRWLGTMAEDEGARERAQFWADSINARVRFYSTFEADAASAMLVQNNADAIYGDSLRLIPHLLAHPDKLKLTQRWYSRTYLAFGVPRNDLDMRLLMDYALQDMVSDGTLRGLLQGLLPPNSEVPVFNLTPGRSAYLTLRG
ncbi:MAG: transporter substrate-binding domain-containing protein [Anaerolineae bacterium]|nr:transporter substrate-binding domain-containing protein [Anaerolineae bacterium]MDW8171343.1 transporter substrate-binding domain-containing protein [Anaerolineae bacterium]